MSADESASESKQFEMLHQHIDELTREKFELARGLQKQQQMSSSLAEENQRLLDDYNDQVQHLCLTSSLIDAFSSLPNMARCCKFTFSSFRYQLRASALY